MGWRGPGLIEQGGLDIKEFGLYNGNHMISLTCCKAGNAGIRLVLLSHHHRKGKGGRRDQLECYCSGPSLQNSDSGGSSIEKGGGSGKIRRVE